MKILKIICNCLFICIIVSLFMIIYLSFNRKEDIPSINDSSILVVKGESMTPILKNGDLIVIDRELKSKYEINDIVSYSIEGIIVTHEIIDIKEIGEEIRYYTKGVNNVNQDKYYITNDQIIGEYKGIRIPIIGYISIIANTNIGYLLLVIVPLGLIFVFLAVELIKEIKKRGEM